jgi:hypothetical protein
VTSQKEQHLENINDIRSELFQILEGMDYCLDWRPDPESWSVREVITHILNTPPPGVPGILKEMLAGDMQEYDLWADEKYLTPEGQSWDLEQLRGELNRYFGALEETLASATGDDIVNTSVMVHQRNRHWDEPRTAQWLLERLFAGHWREHLDQLRELRNGLGI